MEKTTVELCKEAIEGWRTTAEEILPLCFLGAFIFGCSRKSEEVNFLLENGKLQNPLGIDYFDGLLEKGVNLSKKMQETITCPSCNKEHNKEDNPKFCSGCGTELESDFKTAQT